MITMSLVELRRSVEKIAFWHKSAAIEFLGVCIYIYMYIYIYSTANGPSETVAGEAQRFSGIWLAAIQTDTAQQYLAQLYSPFSLDKNDYDGSRFCLHEYKWFHLHPLVPLVISISQKEKQTTKPTHTNRSFH